jgi:hypothetical protein
MIAYMNHYCVTRREFADFTRVVTQFMQKCNSAGSADAKAILGIPDFYMSGVALTVAFPHGHIGDTALSVLTGGIMTMTNGPFDIAAGDRCTWIWDFEVHTHTHTHSNLSLF